MPEQLEQHVNEGCCKFCGARLSLVKRMSRQEFCSNEHRDAFARVHGSAALGRLQESARPKPPTATPALNPGKRETEAPPAGRPTGSILGLSAQASGMEAPRRHAPPPPPPAPPTVPAQAAGAPSAPTMALARTKQRLKPAARSGQHDPALNRLMEASTAMQEPPAARAPMRFGPQRFVMPPAEPEPEFVRPVAAPPPPAPGSAPPPAKAANAPQPAAPASGPVPVKAVEPEEETVTVERRGARPPASFVLTNQRAYGNRSPRPIESAPWEPLVLTSLALPALQIEDYESGTLKVDGESVPGCVGLPVHAVAGDLMTILVVRATPTLLPGLMELPGGPQVEPNDWGAFRDWVRQRIREQDGPDPADLVELPELQPRFMQGAFVQALFGSDRFWPNPKTYIVFPTRELVRRPLLQHADLPEGQETVPLLVNRQHEAAHRRIIAEWNPIAGDAPIPAANVIPATIAPHGATPDPFNAATRPTPTPSMTVVSQPNLAPQPSVPHASTHQAQPSTNPIQHTGPALHAGHHPQTPVYWGPAAHTYSGGFTGGLSSGPVLPRFGVQHVTQTPTESRPLVVLHRQPPTAKMVDLDLEPADRAAVPAPAPPMVAADVQPEIRHTPSGRPSGRLNVSLRLQTMIVLTSDELNPSSPMRGDEQSLSWTWHTSPKPAVPSMRFGVPRARVPVLQTAVRLAGADRNAEFFLSPSPVEFTATVDQWSAL